MTGLSATRSASNWLRGVRPSSRTLESSRQRRPHCPRVALVVPREGVAVQPFMYRPCDTVGPLQEVDGCTNVEVGAYDLAFVTFAGPWAEARAQWAKPLDGEYDGSTFDDYVGCAFGRNAGGDLRDYRRLVEAGAAVFGANTWLTFV